MVIFLLQKEDKLAGTEGRDAEHGFCDFLLEREYLISKIPRDPTVEILWDKKQSGSTQRGLRVGTRFKEFQQIP